MDNKSYSSDEDDVQVTSFRRRLSSDAIKPSGDKKTKTKKPQPEVAAAANGKDQSDDVTKIPVTGYETIELADGKNADGKPAVVVMVVDDEEEKEKKSLAEKPYSDMGKEDLLRFSDTPFWNRVRLISIIVFWLAWLALLGAVIGLTIVAPRCDAPPNPDWWQKSVIYQVYVRSFYDASGNGIGDIRGLISKLDYLKSLNVSAILLSSTFDSHPENISDYGYEVLSHTGVASSYGTLDDMDELLNATHNTGIKVILDFIPNYTGSRHQWFTESSSSSDYSNPFWNYYIWADCTSGGPPPTNWLSVYGESGWTYNTTRGQCYLHQFLDTQPELNLRSTAVQDELEKVLRFWLDRGVDGFRVSNVEYLFESADFTNETYNAASCTSQTNPYDCYDHKQTRSLPETFDLIARWRSVLDEYTTLTPGQTRVLLTDADVSTNDSLKYYKSGAHLPINYALSQFRGTLNGTALSESIHSWLDAMPTDSTATWLTGDQDRSRFASSIDPRIANAVTMLKLTLPGTALVYYGEEIGMTNGQSGLQDPAGFIRSDMSRDPSRTPMQWTSETQDAGFIDDSTGSAGIPPWLPVNTQPYGNVSVSVEDQVNDTNSLLQFSTKLTLLRSEQKSLSFGRMHYTYSSSNIFSFVREHEGFDRMLVFVNVGAETESSVDLTKASYSIGIPSEAMVVMVTNSSMSIQPDKTVDLRTLKVDPGNGFIAKWAYTRPL